MLQYNSSKRPNATEVLEALNEIISNESEI